MLVKVKKQDLTGTTISQSCFQPLIDIYKSRAAEETNLSIEQMKEQFYEELTQGQSALFMFYVYANHVSKSVIEFYWWNAYFMAQPKSWLALKATFKYFQDEPFLLLLEKIEEILKQHNHPSTLENFSITRDGLSQNTELQASIASLYEEFDNIYPITIEAINQLIEKNLQEFVQLED